MCKNVNGPYTKKEQKQSGALSKEKTENLINGIIDSYSSTRGIGK